MSKQIFINTRASQIFLISIFLFSRDYLKISDKYKVYIDIFQFSTYSFIFINEDEYSSFLIRISTKKKYVVPVLMENTVYLSSIK